MINQYGLDIYGLGSCKDYTSIVGMRNHDLLLEELDGIIKQVNHHHFDAVDAMAYTMKWLKKFPKWPKLNPYSILRSYF